MEFEGKLYVFGGFTSRDVKATDAVQVYDPSTGRWTRRAPMPDTVTHVNAVLDDTVMWVAGGFRGHNPGPAVPNVWRYYPRQDRWEPGPPFPTPLAGGVLVRLGRRLHYYGGYLADRMTNPPDHWVLALDRPDSTWEPAAPLPHPRGHVTGGEVGGALYAVGGAFGHDPTPRDVGFVHRYQPQTDSWSQVAPLPYPVSHVEPSTIVERGVIVVAGGRDNFSRNRRTDVLSRLLAYDAMGDFWTDLGELPQPRTGPAAALLGNELVLAGGGDERTIPVADAWGLSYYDAWHALPALPVGLGEVAAGVVGGHLYVVGNGSRGTLRYDLANARWAPTDLLSQRPFRGDHHAAEELGGRWYLFGGLSGDSRGRTQIYDPATDTWHVGADMPFAAGASASAVIGGLIYVAGGIVGDTTTAQAAVYDPAVDRWRPLPPMAAGRNYAAGGTDGRRFWIFGGRGKGSGGGNEVANGFADVQFYDPATNTWTWSGAPSALLAPMPQARGGMGRAVHLDGEFYILGGETDSGAGATARRVYDRVDIYNPAANTWRRGNPMPAPRHGIAPVAAAGRILVAGGGDRAGLAFSNTFDYYTPPRRGLGGPSVSAAASPVPTARRP